MIYSAAPISLVRDYQTSDVDMASDPSYVGFLAVGGRWYIQKINEAAGTHRYVSGTDDYATNWANRATLTYKYFDQVFIL